MLVSRRSVLKTGVALAVCGALEYGLPAVAEGLKLPLGIQLYSVRALLSKDFEGTLQMLESIGYREVEAAGFYGHKADDVLRAMKAAQLHCVSSHHPYDDLHVNLEALLEFHRELGTEYVVCASPGRRPGLAKAGALDLDDWRWMADQLNAFGERFSAAGMRFGYHNHFQELTRIDGVVPYTELIKRTDPAHVTMEMDCGWVVAGGGGPLEYLKEFPARISMLHVKDFAKPTPAQVNPERYTVTELGRGCIDYQPIFEEAKKSGQLRHIFVEQEEYDMPVRESLTVDAEYMRRLHWAVS